MSLAKEAAERWSASLAASDPVAIQAELEREMRAGHLTYKDRCICQVLRPLFVERAAHEWMLRASRLVVRAIHKAMAVLDERPALYERLGFTEVERRLTSIGGGFSPHDLIGRLDAFLQPDGTVRFLEYNGESPGGVAFGDALGGLFDRLPMMQELRSELALTRYPAMPQVVRAFRDEYAAWCRRNGVTPKPRPHVAILDIPGVATVGEFHLFARLFSKYGMPASVVTTDDIVLEDGALKAHGKPIDLVYRRLVTQDLLARLSPDHTIVRAMAENVCLIANGFEGYKASNKGLFSLLSDPAQRPPTLTEEEIGAIDASLPWTRLCEAGRTTAPDRPNGPTEPLDVIVKRLKNRLVLKPTAGYGGQSVVLGWTQSDAEWTAAWENAKRVPHVVQEKVAIPAESFPVLRGGKVESFDLQFDVDPYVLQGSRTYGVGVRLSAGELLNVAAGAGSAVPAYVVG